MKELASLLDNHRLEVEALQDKINDLQAHKDMSIYLVNTLGFDSISAICDHVRAGENDKQTTY